MYTAGLSDAYGYGRVYREYPQAPFQQVARPGAGSPPIRFPVLGAWQPGIMDGPNPAAVWAMNNRRLSILAVGAPATEAATVLPWTVESAHGAAIHRKDNVTYLARAQSFPVTDQPVKFPFLGQWWPHLYDVPDPMPTVDNWVNRLEHLPVGGPAIRFPPLGSWQPESMDPPDPRAIWHQFKLPRVLDFPGTQIPFPFLGGWQPRTMDSPYPKEIWNQFKLPKNSAFVPFIPAWTWETAHAAPVQRLDQVLYLARSSNIPIGSLPVKFPSLGAWQPHSYDVPDLGAVALTALQKRQVLPVGADPITFPKLGQWLPEFMDGPSPLVIWNQLKLPIVRTPPPPLTAPWTAELKNLAPIQRLDAVLYLVTPQYPPAGNPAVAFPVLGKWQPGTYDVPDLGAVSRTYLQTLQLRPVGGAPVAFPKLGLWQTPSMDGPSPLPIWAQLRRPKSVEFVPLTPAWANEVGNHAALQRLDQVLYLVSPANLPVGSPPVAFPALGRWQPGTYDVPDLGAVSRTYLQELQIRPVGADPVAFPKRGQWQPYGMDGPSPGAIWAQFTLPKIPTIVPLVSPWLGELKNWAAIQRFDEVLYLAALPRPPVGGAPAAFPLLGRWQPGTMDGPNPLPTWLQRTYVLPQADLVRLVGPWVGELQSLAALQYKGQVVYLPRRGFGDGPPLSVATLPALLGRANWAALNATQEVVYLVRYPYGKSTGRLQVYDSVAGVWRTSLHIWVYDAGAAQWRLVDNLWVFDSSANTWRLSH